MNPQIKCGLKSYATLARSLFGEELMSTTPLRVEHSKRTFEFFIRMSKEDESRSILQYRKLANNVMDIYHTEVPVEHQGKGVAKVLVNFRKRSDMRLTII
ncbi:hypothetical protein L596_003843 [Steinernema carpocapsae]|uniref:Protein NATD1 n=2 Tax=Steinernema carpocapsae TaxID=34508 RepID=A0A4V6I847_STECR|nr:hypothetical protein L596_003843 [Steinernema carpocapsae]